jgi:hypothetical protein
MEIAAGVARQVSPQWRAELRVSQPVRAVDLHHVLGHDHLRPSPSQVRFFIGCQNSTGFSKEEHAIR